MSTDKKVHKFAMASRSIAVIGFSGKNDALEFLATIAEIATSKAEEFNVTKFVKAVRGAKEFLWALGSQTDMDELKKKEKKRS